jgi:hypothetical protein
MYLRIHHIKIIMWFYLTTSIATISSLFVIYKYRNIQIGKLYDTLKTYTTGTVLFFKFIKNYDSKTILQSGRQLVTYYISQKLVEVNGKYVTLHYPYGVHWYKLRFKRKLGPCRIVDIKDEHENNVTEVIKTYLGPSYDFHGIPTTPYCLGYESLTFEYMNGTNRQFKNQEIICL